MEVLLRNNESIFLNQTQADWLLKQMVDHPNADLHALHEDGKLIFLVRSYEVVAIAKTRLT